MQKHDSGGPFDFRKKLVFGEKMISKWPIALFLLPKNGLVINKETSCM